MMLVSLLVLVGCGGSSSDGDTVNQTEAEKTVSNLEEGISNENQAKIKDIVASDGIEVTTSSGTNVYTEDQFANQLEDNEELNQLFSIKNKTITSESDSQVVIRGEVANFNNQDMIDLQGLEQQDIKNKITKIVAGNYRKQSKTDNITSLNNQNYSGKYFDLNYPEAWKSISTLDSTAGMEMFVATPDVMVSQISMYIERSDSLVDYDLDEFVSYLNLMLTNNSNYESTIDEYTLDGISAKELKYSYTQEYYPTMVEITVEKKEDKWYITKIIITTSEQVKTREIKGKNILTFNNNGLYWLIYTGINGKYNNYLNQGTGIIESFIIN
jgi:hypothetical protein